MDEFVIGENQKITFERALHSYTVGSELEDI
jgi:hypothetical protein